MSACTPCRALMATVLGLVLASPASGITEQQIPPESEWPAEFRQTLSRFELFTECRPMGLMVRFASKGPTVTLPRDIIHAAIERRLRGARIYESNRHFRLMVDVTVFGPAFRIDVTFAKWLHDPHGSGAWGPAGTWRWGSSGMHGNEAAFIVDTTSHAVDHFVNEFLRVNAQACSSIMR